LKPFLFFDGGRKKIAKDTAEAIPFSPNSFFKFSKIFIFLVITLLSFSLISSEENFGYGTTLKDRSYLKIYYMNTTLNETQFNTNNNTTSIDISWLTTFINSVSKWDDYVLNSDLGTLVVSLVGNYSDNEDLIVFEGDGVSRLVNDAGYLTAESDPIWTADKTNYYNKTEIDNKGYLTAETDPVYTSDKPNIVFDGDNISRLVNDVGYLTSESDPLSLHLNQSTPQTIVDGIPLLSSDRNFTSMYQIVDKKYVDEAVTSLGARYYMTDTDAGIEDYKLCSLTPSSDTEKSISKNDLTDDQYIIGWISPNTNEPDKLIAGVYNWRIYAEKTGGTKTIRFYWKLFERKSNGSEVEIGTSIASNEIVSGKNSYIIPLTLSSDYDVESDSYVVGKIYADVSGSGNAPSVTIYYEGDSDSHWEIPTNLEILNDRYVQKSGDTMTGPLNLPSDGLAVGTDQLVVKNGKVGIGTATPILPLEVVGGVQLGAGDRIWWGAGNGWIEAGETSDTLTIGTSFSGTAITIDPNQNIGIGTTSPQGKVEIRGGDLWVTKEGDNGLRIRSGLNSSKYGFNSSFGNNIAFINEQGITNQVVLIGDSGPEDTGVLFGVANTLVGSNPTSGDENWSQRFTILGNGNIGIGTTSPDEKLHVYDGELKVEGTNGYRFTLTPGSLAGPRVQLGGSSSPDQYFEIGAWGGDNWFDSKNRDLRLETYGNTGQLFLSTNGNIGIGNILPRKLLHIGDTISSVLTSPYIGGVTISADGGEVNRGLHIVSASNAASGDRGVLVGVRARGTLTSPTAVQNGDQLFSVGAVAYDGSILQYPSNIDFYVDGEVSSGSTPTSIRFTTGANSSTRESRVVISSDGNVGLAKTSPYYPLDIDKDVDGISIYTSGNISATGYITRTPTWDSTKGKALDKIVDLTKVKEGDKINHKKYNVDVVKMNITKLKGYINKSDVVVKCKKVKIYVPCKNETNLEECYKEEEVCKEELITYREPVYEVEEIEGVLLDDLVAKHEQALFELNKKIEELEDRIKQLEEKCVKK